MSAPWYREFYSSINQAEKVTRSPVSFLFLLAHPFLVKFRLEGLVSVEIIHSEPNRAINQELQITTICRFWVSSFYCFWRGYANVFGEYLLLHLLPRCGMIKKTKTFSEDQVSSFVWLIEYCLCKDLGQECFSKWRFIPNQWDYSHNLRLQEEIFSYERSRNSVGFYTGFCEKEKWDLVMIT